MQTLLDDIELDIQELKYLMQVLATDANPTLKVVAKRNILLEVPSLPSRGPLTLPRPTVIKSPEWNPTATVAARFSTASGL